ncbi:RIP metalloprotease RseP [Wenyingzhuangia sp. IMCC45574]
MENLIIAGQFLLSLSLLIVLHELGHFIPAKLFKTKVEKFYLFFDYKFSLFKKKIGETVYGIGWIPLGGYVKIAGMIDESMDTEQMKQEPKPWEFRSKPAWQRLIIMLGGVIVNFILGLLIYIMIFATWGEKKLTNDSYKDGILIDSVFKTYGLRDGDKFLKMDGEELDDLSKIGVNLFLRGARSLEVAHTDGVVEKIVFPENIADLMWETGAIRGPIVPVHYPVIDSVYPDTSAEKYGLLKGDVLKSFNGKEIVYWSDFISHFSDYSKKYVKKKPNLFVRFLNLFKKKEEIKYDSISLVVERSGTDVDITLTPSKSLLGFRVASPPRELNEVNYTFVESISKGYDKAYWTLKDYMAQFKYVFTSKGASSMGGFISIAKIFPEEWDWQKFWANTAFLSIMLGFMNLLPIPALDGGHVVFTLYEMITRRKPNDKVLEYAQITGFVLLLSLLAFANGNDLVKLVSGWF